MVASSGDSVRLARLVDDCSQGELQLESQAARLNGTKTCCDATTLDGGEVVGASGDRYRAAPFRRGCVLRAHTPRPRSLPKVLVAAFFHHRTDLAASPVIPLVA